MKIIYCFPLPTDNIGISYTALSLYRGMKAIDVDVEFVTPVVRREIYAADITQAVPLIFRYLPWKYLKNIAAHYFTRAVLQMATKDTIIYLWSNHPPEFAAQLRAKGAIVIAEKFNTAQKSARAILSAEYRRLGLPNGGQITDQTIDNEMRLLGSVNYVFSPSPMVKQSLQDVGIDTEVLESSYGWGYSDGIPSALLPDVKGPIFLFVGSVEVRKGAHLLLEYWKAASIQGTLVFLGAVREEMKALVIGKRLIASMMRPTPLCSPR